MNLLTNHNELLLWQDTIKHAENRCSISLHHDLEAYLVTLLAHYIDKPELVKQIFAAAFLEAKQSQNCYSLQKMGDQCLLFAGLFPHVAEKKLVTIGYFVNLGQSAYSAISSKNNDLFGLLSYQFVALMDVLQSIRPHPDLLPLEAYELWQEVGSQRALKILKEYTQHHGLPK